MSLVDEGIFPPTWIVQLEVVAQWEPLGLRSLSGLTRFYPLCPPFCHVRRDRYDGRGVGRAVRQGGRMLLPAQGMPGGLARTMSAQVASSSHALLHALESADIEQVRGVLLTTDRGLKR